MFFSARLLLAGGALVAAALAPMGEARGADAYVDGLVTAARAKGLARTRMWQVLLHYRPTATGGMKSEADGLGFFLSGPVGKRDPERELEATLAGLFAPPTAEAQTKHARCLFPARAAWLIEELAIEPARLPVVACPVLDWWKNTVGGRSATMIFAAAYLNSPASLYGHTFMRLSRTSAEGNALLDYAVSFAADPDTQNGLLYALFGLTGGFPGRFYVTPYYVKVQEYSNMESRDLWEYELALSPEQVERLVLHTWELRSTTFDYFFFTENCSYQLLSLLEVANPSLHLVERFHLRVIPADTVRLLFETPGFVVRRRPRPSQVAAMTTHRRLLRSSEVRAAERLIDVPLPDAPAVLAPFAKERQALILDAAQDYYRYRVGLKQEQPEEVKLRERALLILRGRTGVAAGPDDVRPMSSAPETGHGTFKVGVGGGATTLGGSFEELSLRPAIHDLLDDRRGYGEDAALEMAHLRLRFDNQRRRPSLESFDGVHILSVAPFDSWIHKPSWMVRFGADNAHELGCLSEWRCLYFGVQTGSGIAARFGPERRVLALLMAGLDLGTGPAFRTDHYYRLGGGAMVALGARLATGWRVQIEGSAFDYLLGDRRANLRASAFESLSLGQSLELRLGVRTAGTYGEAAGALAGYF